MSIYADLHLSENYIKHTLENECNYNSNQIDYILDMILKIINYQKRTKSANYYVTKISQEKLVYIWYPMSITLTKKSYSVPILIFIMKNIPLEAPLIFLDIPEKVKANSFNNNITDLITGQIKTNTLQNWEKDSNIINVMDEIFFSFSQKFPLYIANESLEPNRKSIFNYLNDLIRPKYNIYGYKEEKSFGGGIYGCGIIEKKEENSSNKNIYGDGISDFKREEKTSNNEKKSILEENKKQIMNNKKEIIKKSDSNPNKDKSLFYESTILTNVEKQKVGNDSRKLNDSKKSPSYFSSILNFFKSSKKENNLKDDKADKGKEILNIEQKDIEPDNNEDIQKNENIKKYIEIITKNNEEIDKLKNENKEIKNEINIIKNENKKFKKYEEDYKKLEKKYETDTKKLNNQIKELTNKYENSEKKNLDEIKNKLNNDELKDEIIKLSKELRSKEEELKKIKSKIGFEIKEDEQIMTLIFTSVDQKIQRAFICKDSDKLHQLEGVLYDIFPEYKNQENIFLCHGTKINKFKTMKDNKIRNSDIVVLVPLVSEEIEN